MAINMNNPRLDNMVCVTPLAHKLNSGYAKAGYDEIFVHKGEDGFWLARLLKNHGENYAPSEGSYIVELDNSYKYDVFKYSSYKDASLDIATTHNMIKSDYFDYWSYYVFDSKADALAFVLNGCVLEG